MATKFISEKNLKFLLYDVFEIEALTKYDYYEDHNGTVFDMVIRSAVKLAKDLLWPVFEEMDRNQPTLENGTVRVHPSVKKILKAFGEGGWISTTVPYDLDGEQLPHMIADACHFIFAAANYSASAFPGLSDGAARLIEKFGDQYLYHTYVPMMRGGKWQGTMALTEPEAGSSLSDITTGAVPTGNGFYHITGQKIFISAGDHDGAENVIHLMLAKIEGAPAGVKGISLFVVPKKRLNASETLVSNDVVTSGVYHKLGYRGCPIVQLSIGDKNDCHGWLVGAPGRVRELYVPGPGGRARVRHAVAVRRGPVRRRCARGRRLAAFDAPVSARRRARFGASLRGRHRRRQRHAVVAVERGLRCGRDPGGRLDRVGRAGHGHDRRQDLGGERLGNPFDELPIGRPVQTAHRPAAEHHDDGALALCRFEDLGGALHILARLAALAAGEPLVEPLEHLALLAGRVSDLARRVVGEARAVGPHQHQAAAPRLKLRVPRKERSCNSRSSPEKRKPPPE